MLFNSSLFIFVFLPTVLAVFCLLACRREALATIWLAGASLAFYAYWGTEQIWVLLVSIAGNYLSGLAIAHRTRLKLPKKLVLTVSVAANLSLLGYFKYYEFFTVNLAAFFTFLPLVAHIALPLGISFFTFTQISYLVDVYRGKVHEFSPLNYFLFVSYFPHLIAGPILHHAEMIPQFKARNYVFRIERISVGLTIFIIGLFKKVVLADSVSVYVGPVFASLDVTQIEAWLGALSYTLQIYFDFSGYTDMAIGISYLFGIRLPLNFNSPYKAVSIVDFWRRWHMTLSRFLRDYLYIPLGGNRRGKARRYFNLLATMLLGGLWHGANWTFVIWGTLHGIFLAINHIFSTLTERLGWPCNGLWWRISGRAMTFLAVVFAWVFFRAESFDSAIAVVRAMVGLNGKGLGSSPFSLGAPAMVVGILLVVVFFAPNTQEFMARFRPQLDEITPVRISWEPNAIYATAIALMAAASLTMMTKESPFLYYQF
jgi:alginate O-acetyltransferase complex protein AlgI